MKTYFPLIARVMIAAVLGCASLLFAIPAADAMTLGDLQGDYRVVEQGEQPGRMGMHNEGTTVRFASENGELVGRVLQPAQASFFKSGNVTISSVCVDGGVIHCQFSISPGDVSSGIIRVGNSGAMLKVFAQNKEADWYWILKRI